MSIFGERLNNLRQSRGLTQQDLADHFHISNSTISSYENGTRIPDIDFLKELAKFYGVSSDYLIGLSDTMLLPDILDIPMIDGVLYRSILEKIQKLSAEHKLALNITLDALYRCSMMQSESNATNSTDPEKAYTE